MLFRSDILLGVHDARKIVADEQSAFFKLQTFAKIDLGSVLRSASTDAKALAATLENPIVRRQAALQEAMEEEEKEIRVRRRRLSEMEERIDGFDALLQRRKKNLESAENSEEKASIRKEIQELRSAKSSAESDLISTRSELISWLK